MVSKADKKLLRELKEQRAFLRPVVEQQKEIKRRETKLKKFVSKKQKDLSGSDLVIAEQQIKELEKEKGKLSRRKFVAGARKDFSKAGRELRSFAKQVRREQVPIRQPVMQQQFRQPVQPQRRGTGIKNFFVNRSNREVFGGDSLSLFDSNKASRSNFSTASMFGIG